jgi:signal-transduction protein with cAMP-binding, CBS, and nucleotidyltransferase domain
MLILFLFGVGTRIVSHLDDILSRLVNMETHCQTIDNEILEIREQLKRHTINLIYITGW